MLLNCLTCNAKYLVNSADLKPNGRTVQCSSCGHEWFQDLKLVEEDDITSFKSDISDQGKNLNKDELPISSNLPSTYVVEVKPSYINSILLIFFIFIAIFIFRIFTNEGYGILVLLNFYIHEFYFNLKLIINDLAKIIHQIVN